MTVTQTFTRPLPEDVIAEVRDYIGSCKQEYKERDFDYFEYILDHGNDIQEIKRGTVKWQELNTAWCEQWAEDYCLMTCWRKPTHEPEWYDHLTGQKSPTYTYPGWHFQTFRDAMVAAAHELIEGHYSKLLSDDEFEAWCETREYDFAEVEVDSIL